MKLHVASGRFFGSEPEPGAGNASAGFFVTPSAPQRKGPCIFYETLSLKKTITSLYFFYEMV
ncbi:hypothetical protein J6TS7_39330 [Paenibacillus dendritiformis]|nr:hypothetical protein J6TS7_39330 [Paenibacillus dendritiformis]